MNIMLIYGGKSCEHDISIITAGIAKRYFADNILCCYLDSDNKAFLMDNSITPQAHKNNCKNIVTFHTGCNYITTNKRKKTVIDCAVNCCHGNGVEDGSIAGLLSLTTIPLVGSGVVASAIAMSKTLVKQVLGSYNINTIEGVMLTTQDIKRGIVPLQPLGYPVIVKPDKLGSSIGITIANNEQELHDSIALATKYDNRILVEKAITNRYELNCSAMTASGNILVSDVEMPMSDSEIFSFADKYLVSGKGMASGNTPPDDHIDTVKLLTRRIYSILGMSGVVRVDYIVDKDTNTVYVNEINTIPGSLAYSLWSKKFTPQQFGRLLVLQAIVDSEANKALAKEYSSAVLSVGTAKK